MSVRVRVSTLATKSALRGSQSTAPATKYALRGSPSTAPATKSAFEVHQVLRMPRTLHFEVHHPLDQLRLKITCEVILFPEVNSNLTEVVMKNNL